MLKRPNVFVQNDRDAYERYLKKYPNDGINYRTFCKALSIYNKELFDRVLDGQVVKIPNVDLTILITKIVRKLDTDYNINSGNTVKLILDNEIDPYIYIIKVIPGKIRTTQLYTYRGLINAYGKMYAYCKKIKKFPYLKWDLNLFKRR